MGLYMLSVLGNHLDALYLSIKFDFPEKLQELFWALRQEAQNSGDDTYEFLAIPRVPGGVFYIRPYGRGKYQYVLENASVWMAWTTWRNMPTIDFQFKAVTLYEYEAHQLGEIVHRIVSYFIGESEYKVKVSRADVAVDFQKDSFELPEIHEYLTRARRRHFEYRGTWANSITLGERQQALQAEIYCKSLELDVSEKDWMLDVWRASGLYDEALPVWRAELRMYREGLHAFGVDTLDELLVSLGDLCSYGAGDGPGAWLRITDPADRHLKDRSARRSAGWWGTVSKSLSDGLGRSGRKRKGYDPKPSFMRAVELAGAHMARAASLARLSKTGKGVGPDLYILSKNPRMFAAEVGRIYEERLRLANTDWAEKVNLRTAELRGVAW